MADPITERALFAERFSGTQNPEQRRRFAQDITLAKDRDSDRRAQEFEELQLRNPKVGQLVLSRKREERMGQAQRFQQGLAEERLALDEERMALSLRAEQRAIQKARLDMKKAELDMDRKLREESDTLSAEEEEFALREQFKPGSEDYKKGVLNLALRYPGLSKDYRRTMLESAGYTDPDAAYKAAADFAQQNPGSRVSGVPLPGGSKGTIVGPSKPRELATVQKELDAARRMWGLAKKDAEPSNIEYAEARVRQLEEEAKNLGGVTGPKPTGNRPALTDIFK